MSDVETKNSLSFLDIKIFRTVCFFSFSQCVLDGVSVNYESLMPKSFKFDLIFSLLQRGFKLYSISEPFHEELGNFEINIYK